jgi:diaminopimelate decarboxylase
MNRLVERRLREIRSRSDQPLCAYVYDLAGIRSHVAAMLAAMPPKTRLFYAIKANPDKRIIEALLPLVAGFEVASAGELLRVREVSRDVPILFGGPGKKDFELRTAIAHNVAYLHVESLLELRKIIMYANEGKRRTQVLLRINLRSKTLPQTKIAMGGRPSPFGLDEAYIGEAAAILREPDNRYVQFCGFHFHSLSNNPDAELHAAMVQHYLEKASEWERLFGLDVQIVNAGGGFGVAYDGSPGFDWRRFAFLLGQSEAVRNPGAARLIFEPGRLIVADYGYYAAEVVDIKRSHDCVFAVVRGGTHHNRLPASWGHNHPFRILEREEWPYAFERPEAKHSRVTIVGELCTPKDRLHADAELDRLRVGDVLVFEKSGAYCWTISHHDFLSHPHPEFHYLTEGDQDE